MRTALLLLALVAGASAAPLAWPTLYWNPYILDNNARRVVDTASSRKGLVDLLSTDSALLAPYNWTIPAELQNPAGANLLADAITANLQLWQYSAGGATRYSFWANNITHIFSHGRYLVNATTSSGGGPNHDTIYSSSNLELSQGPVVFTLPPSHDIHYFSALFVDVFGNIEAKIISTQQGVQDGGNWVFVQRGYDLSNDELREIQRLKANVIDWPYTAGGVILRTLVSRPDQYPSIWAFQNQLSLRLLSGRPWVNPPNPVGVLPELNRLGRVIKNLTATDYPAYITQLILAFQENPPVNLNHQSTDSVLNALSTFNIDSALPFDLSRLNSNQTRALWLGYQLAQGLVELAEVHSYEYLYPSVRYSLRFSQGTNELLLAAINADFNYAGNLAEDTVYGWVFTDTDGELLNGNHSYAITVDPAPYYKASTGFWSLTAYDDQLQLIDNPINRYSVSDRADWQGPGTPLRYNPDGTLTVYVSPTRPDASVQPWYDNWLPVPNGTFVLLFRWYDPTSLANDGTWAGWPLSKVTAPAPVGSTASPVSPVDVSPVDSPASGDASPVDVPSPGDVPPVDSPASGDASPVDVPPAVDSPASGNASPIDAPSPVDVSPVDSPASGDVSPVDTPLPVDVSPVDSPAAVDASPVDVPPAVDVSPVDPPASGDAASPIASPADVPPAVDVSPVDSPASGDASPVDIPPPVDASPVASPARKMLRRA